MKLRVWYISAHDDPEGQSSRTFDHATALSMMGHEVTMFTSSYNHFTHEERLEKSEKWREEWFGKVRVIWLKTFPYKGNGWQRAVNMFSNAWQAYWRGCAMKDVPDIVFGPSVPLFTGLSAYLLAKRKKSTFCFEVRDIWPQALIDLGVLSAHSPIVWVLRFIETFLYRRAARIIAVLPFAYRHICRYNIPEKQIVWIPNGVNLDRFAQCGRYSGGQSNQLTAMYVGGFSSTHGIEAIVEAARLLQEEGTDQIRIILVGVGRGKDHLIGVAEENHLQNIEFRRYVSKSKIARILEEADVLIASVKDTPVYQFGINSNKIFDYLASGRPIIFAGAAPNDPVAEAEAGISIPPESPRVMAEALKTFLFMSPRERQQLGNNGRKHAEEQYDVKVLSKKLEKVLLEIIGK